MYTLYRQVGELQCLVLKAQLQQAVGLFGWWGGEIGDQRPEGSQSGHVEIPKSVATYLKTRNSPMPGIAHQWVQTGVDPKLGV